MVDRIHGFASAKHPLSPFSGLSLTSEHSRGSALRARPWLPSFAPSALVDWLYPHLKKKRKEEFELVFALLFYRAFNPNF